MGIVAVFFGDMMAEDMGTVDVAGMEIAIKVDTENMRIIIEAVPPRPAIGTMHKPARSIKWGRDNGGKSPTRPSIREIAIFR
jgi:hypothetical protein